MSELLNDNKYIAICAIWEAIPSENIHYEGYITKYLDTHRNIDNLPMGKVLLGDLRKVGWVVLKCDYDNTPNSTEQN